MKPLCRCLAALALLLLAPSTDAQGVFVGATTADFGTGTGGHLDVTWDAPTHSLRTTVTATSGNALVHVIAVGLAPLPFPTALPAPFVPGSQLFVFPEFVPGIFPGDTSLHPIPLNPDLLGVPFFSQGFLAQGSPIVPSTTQGAVTMLQ